MLIVFSIFSRLHSGRILNLALTKKLAGDMTYVTGQFFPHIFFLAPSHKRLFSKMAAHTFVGTITFERLGGYQSNLTGWFSRYF